jgi:glycosyltransferase involved in cell wall biosynthesis
LKIAQHIQWIGWPSYSEGLKQYSWADAFAFTSLRDTSGTGLLESLAAGTPIVGVNHQGAHDIMTPQCSIPVSVDSPTMAVEGFKNAIIRLAGDPVLWRRLSEGAVNRTVHFSWERLSDEIDAAYESALCPERSNDKYWPEKRCETVSINRPTLAPLLGGSIRHSSK